MSDEYSSSWACKYDKFSPCEYCGKCRKGYDYNDEPDPDREYELARDEDRL